MKESSHNLNDSKFMALTQDTTTKLKLSSVA